MLCIAVGASLNNSYAQTASQNQARALYFAALEAYDAKEYEEVLDYISDITNLLGANNARLSSLKVKTLYEKGDIEGAKTELNAFFALTSSEAQGREMASYMRKIRQAEKEAARIEELKRQRAEARRIAAKKAEEARLLAEKRAIEQARLDKERKAKEEKDRRNAIIAKEEKRKLIGIEHVKASTATIALPGGEYMMGCSRNDSNCKSREKPRQRVRIKPFKMGTTEVTKRQFEAFVINTDYKTTAEKNGFCVDRNDGLNWQNVKYGGDTQDNNHPVICVSLIDVDAYITWLNAITERSFRLPTESEWEYAARAGNKKKYFFGTKKEKLCLYGNVNDRTGSSRGNRFTKPIKCRDEFFFTSPVGIYNSNKFGIFDTIGNVAEYTSSCYTNSFSSFDVDSESRDVLGCAANTVRGSTFLNSGHAVSRRYSASSISTSIATGFRLAEDITNDSNQYSQSKQGQGNNATYDQAAKRLTIAYANYPPMAARDGVESNAKVEFVIDKKGNVDSCKVISEDIEGYGFGKQACNAVRKWEYLPAIMNGKPVRSSMTTVINFSLSASGG